MIKIVIFVIYLITLFDSNISDNLVNLSDISWQSPPICLQNFSGVHS